MCLLSLGNVEEACQLANEAVVIAHYSLLSNHKYIALCKLLMKYKNLSDALFNAYLLMCITDMDQLAWCYHRAGRKEDVIDMIRRCIAIEKQNLPLARSDLCTRESQHYCYSKVSFTICAAHRSSALRPSCPATLPPLEQDCVLFHAVHIVRQRTL